MGGVCGIGSIKGRLSPIGSLQGALSIPVGGGLDCDIYEGEYNLDDGTRVRSYYIGFRTDRRNVLWQTLLRLLPWRS